MEPPVIYNPAPGVYVAVGYDLANTILIVNNGESILIDTVGSVSAAKTVVAAFEAYFQGPIPTIVAVFYTHSHLDHFSGTSAFNIAPGTPIWAHQSFLLNLQKFVASSPIILPRSANQFGFFLRQLYGETVDGFLSAGIGPFLSYGNDSKVLPNSFFATATNVTYAGLDIQLYFTPGETDDTISIFFPSLKVACIGDNMYKTFANLYAIRGTPPRNAKLWYESIDKIRALKPDVVLGSHTSPLVGGNQVVEAAMKNYRDAIAYVHDQTVIKMNQGMHIDDIALSIQLPENLRSDPYLSEFYGYIPHCSKAIYNSYLGWFSGYLEDLDTLSTSEYSNRIVKLAGGVELAIIKAVEALNEGTLEGAKWALQLSSAINRTITPDSEQFEYVQSIFVQAAQIIGFSHTSSNARNYYLSIVEKYDAGAAAADFINRKNDLAIKSSYFSAPLSVFMDSLYTLLNYQKTENIFYTVRVKFVNENREAKEESEEYVIDIRRQVVEVYPSSFSLTELYEDSLEIEVAPNTFKSVLLGITSVKEELAAGKITSPFSEAEILFFFDLFRN
jgi:alkyl sulfatase BDS1-like metallo-beta-lactamase superfamily hydrolase